METENTEPVNTSSSIVLGKPEFKKKTEAYVINSSITQMKKTEEDAEGSVYHPIIWKVKISAKTSDGPQIFNETYKGLKRYIGVLENGDKYDTIKCHPMSTAGKVFECMKQCGIDMSGDPNGVVSRITEKKVKVISEPWAVAGKTGYKNIIVDVDN